MKEPIIITPAAKSAEQVEESISYETINYSEADLPRAQVLWRRLGRYLDQSLDHFRKQSSLPGRSRTGGMVRLFKESSKVAWKRGCAIVKNGGLILAYLTMCGLEMIFWGFQLILTFFAEQLRQRPRRTQQRRARPRQGEEEWWRHRRPAPTKNKRRVRVWVEIED